MKFSWKTELPQWVVIGAMFVVAAVSWSHVPERIPVHWNWQGEVDGYGGRFVGLALLPLMSLGLYLLLRLLPRIDPGRANYANFAGAYNVIRLTILLVMAVIYAAQVMAALGRAVDMSTVALLATAAMFLVLGSLMHRIQPNWFVGVRTPWTLSSKLSWNKTHRVAGWLMIAWAALLGAAGIFRSAWMFAGMMTAIIGGTIGLFAYSYVVYRQDPERIGPAGTSPGTE